MVSVIIPCHNCEGFIGRAIKSVLDQTYKNIEIILINNNSVDNTLQVLQDYRSEFPNKISVLEEFKPGAPAARNCGLENAKGEWVQFLDADDELLADKLIQQVHILRCTNADVIVGNCLLEYTGTRKITKVIRRTDTNVWRGLITSNLGITSSNLWRKSSLLDVNGWDETVTSSQEYDLLFRLIKNKVNIVTDKAINTIVHFSTNSVSKSNDKDKLKKILNNRINLRIKIREELVRRGLLTSDLNDAIDNYIYSEIMSYYGNFPEYAQLLLDQYKPKIKISKRLKSKSKLILKDLLSKKG